jgi:AraC family transcriptional regulator, regulatory protein of adaptative response / methylated-DNA-[protein]-cysteine methyltransferase
MFEIAGPGYGRDDHAMTDSAAPTTAPETPDDARWARVVAKDRGADGSFVTCVKTTGIYCRPSCPARPPKRANVEFRDTPAEAEAAGYRACLRCRPDSVTRDEAAVAAIVAAIREATGAAEETPTLEALATLTGYSPAHLQRVFKRAVGLSPAAYARALKAQRTGDALTREGSVAGAIYAAGFSAPSRFYAANERRLGMKPSAWVAGGAGVTIHWAVIATSLGDMLVAATDKGVCRLSFDEDEAALAARFPKAILVEGGAEFADLFASVVAAVEAPGDGRTIPLDVRGTAFQEAVWAELARIPAGETRSYADIAAAIGRPRAVRAAGSANGANNVAVLIPCHRVIRGDGSLGGYAYGLERKRELLDREAGQRRDNSQRLGAQE